MWYFILSYGFYGIFIFYFGSFLICAGGAWSQLKEKDLQREVEHGADKLVCHFYVQGININLLTMFKRNLWIVCIS
jgi:hypothetical protein